MGGTNAFVPACGAIEYVPCRCCVSTGAVQAGRNSDDAGHADTAGAHAHLTRSKHEPGVTLPNPGAAPTPAPAIATPAPAVAAPAAPAPAALVPGCPGRADCPPEPGAEGALSEAAKEIIKELVKCEVEGKSIDECLSDDPPPPRLAELNEAERSQLKSCLGSNDLAATQDLWSTCVPGLR